MQLSRRHWPLLLVGLLGAIPCHTAEKKKRTPTPRAVEQTLAHETEKLARDLSCANLAGDLRMTWDALEKSHKKMATIGTVGPVQSSWVMPEKKEARGIS